MYSTVDTCPLAAVDLDLELRGGEVGDLPAVVVERGDVDGNQLDAGTKDRLGCLRCLRCLGCLRCRRCRRCFRCVSRRQARTKKDKGCGEDDRSHARDITTWSATSRPQDLKTSRPQDLKTSVELSSNASSRRHHHRRRPFRPRHRHCRKALQPRLRRPRTGCARRCDRAVSHQHGVLHHAGAARDRRAAADIAVRQADPRGGAAATTGRWSTPFSCRCRCSKR